MGAETSSSQRAVAVTAPALTATAAACSRFRMAGVGWDFYDGLMRACGYPTVCGNGLVMHVAGPAGNDWFMTNYWLSRDHAEAFFRDQAMPAILRYLRDAGEHPDIEPDSLAVESLALGAPAWSFVDIGEDVGGSTMREFDGRPVLLASAETTLERPRYMAAVEALGGGLPPPGMIMRASGSDAGGDWWAHEIWRSADAAAAAAPAIAETAERIELRRISISPLFVTARPVVS